MLQKSNTFSSLSAAVSSKRSTTSTIGSWFDRRARKLSMKCSKSITLGKKQWWNGMGKRETFFFWVRTALMDLG